MAKLKEYPDEGELVVGTVSKVQNFGAFIQLEEYPGREGFCHIRDVAAGWVKRIRDHVREQQRVVCKVQGVDKRKGHVDLSLKAVNDHQRRETIQNWKNEQKADKLIEMYAEKEGISVDDFKQHIAPRLVEVWDGIYAAFQEAAEYGEGVFAEEGIEEDWVPSLVAFAKDNIQASFVDLTGFVEVQSAAPDGVQQLSKALATAEESEYEDVQITVTYHGAPHYRLHVQAPDFKIAEDEMRKAADRAIKAMQQAGGTGRFHRELEHK